MGGGAVRFWNPDLPPLKERELPSQLLASPRCCASRIAFAPAAKLHFPCSFHRGLLSWRALGRRHVAVRRGLHRIAAARSRSRKGRGQALAQTRSCFSWMTWAPSAVLRPRSLRQDL